MLYLKYTLINTLLFGKRHLKILICFLNYIYIFVMVVDCNYRFKVSPKIRLTIVVIGTQFKFD